MDDSCPFSQHLNTNYAPSDDEANILRNHISDHRAEIAALALKIHDATRALAALQAQQKRHERFVREHTALLSPIRRVPNEILSLIFLACVDDTPGPAPSSTSPLHPSNALSHVCVQWRALALSAPQLWSSLKFNIPDLTSPRPSESPSGSKSDRFLQEEKAYTKWCRQLKGFYPCFTAWLERSSPCGINLTLNSGEVGELVYLEICANVDQVYESVVQFLCQTSSRWRELKIDLYIGPLTNTMMHLFDDPSLEYPLLEKIAIDVRDGDDPMGGFAEHCIQMLTASRLFSSPRLRDVRLDGFWGNIADAIDDSTMPIYTSITRLVLKAEIIDQGRPIYCAQVLELLELLPQLVAVDIDMVVGPNVIQMTPTPIVLPNLTSMSIRPWTLAVGFGPSLSLPQLRSFRHNSRIDRQVLDLQEFGGHAELLLHDCARQLQKITLCHGSFPQSSLLLCMGELVNLVKLELLAATSKGHHCEKSDVFVLSQLSTPGICPKLEEFVFQDISNLHEDGSTEWAIVELFARRRPARRGRAGSTSSEAERLWCSMRKVEISFRYPQKVVIPVALRSREVDMDGIELTVGYPEMDEER
ncbi:hypothetical protein NMY22_g6442 [Coprinellus aureogranulatus]|nr:hypothetical protein NMY22_g6442 [Coprinellus aureogranulatus]